MAIASMLGNSVGSHWEKLKKTGTRLWDRYLENAAPTQRHLDVAYVPLHHLEEKVDIGVFVPELYLIAKAGFLPAQIKAQKILGHPAGATEEDANRLLNENEALFNILYNANTDKLKTPFELAIIDSYEIMYIANQVQNIYTWLRKNGYDWPNSVSKARVESDYLANLGKINIAVKAPGAQSVSFTVKNSTAGVKTHEKIIHFITSWIAPLLTITAFAMMCGVYTLPGLLLFGAGIYLANKCADEFGMHDLAENLSREFGWLKSKEYRQGEFSWRNALHAGLQLAGVIFACTLAAQGAWVGIISMPLLQSLPQIGLLLSGFFAGVAALSTFIGVSSGIRYVRGMSIYDNQIPFVKGEGQDLPGVTSQEEKLKRRLMKGKKEAQAHNFDWNWPDNEIEFDNSNQPLIFTPVNSVNQSNVDFIASETLTHKSTFEKNMRN